MTVCPPKSAPRTGARWGAAASLAVLVATFVPTGLGCYVEEVPPPAYADGYEPQYYDGYVVYYDEGGRPFYYVNGAAVWVPSTSPFYAGYVNHWRLHGEGYRHWYVHHGYRYRGYRGSVHHR